MDYIDILQFAGILILSVSVVIGRVKKTKDHGLDLARIAVKSVAGTKASDFDKKIMAVKAFQLLDQNDNGKRDFSDAKVRILVDSVFKEANNG